MKNVFGWSLPPGVTDADIERAVGSDNECPQCCYEQALEDALDEGESLADAQSVAEQAEDLARQQGGVPCDEHALFVGPDPDEDREDF